MKQATILILILCIGIFCAYKIFGQKGDTMSYQATFGSPLSTADLESENPYLPQFEFRQESDGLLGVKVGPGYWNDLTYLILCPKTYRALITQSGTDDPTVVVAENTIGDIVWTRSDEGIYYGTLAGAFDDSNYKTLVFINSILDLELATDVVKFADFKRHSPDAVVITTGRLLAGAGFVADGYLNETSIEIRVYPL